MKTILTKKELADRWGYNVKTIDAMEEDGIIRRLSKLPGVKFSLAAVEAIEAEGNDNLVMRQRKEILELKSEIMKKNRIIQDIKEVIST